MKTTLATKILNDLTREELNAVASNLNLSLGKSKSNTVTNIAQAITKGKARISGVVSIQTPRTDNKIPLNLAVRKIRTHKPDKTIYVRPVGIANNVIGYFKSP